jgi:hypothetical protein
VFALAGDLPLSSQVTMASRSQLIANKQNKVLGVGVGVGVVYRF